MPIPGDTRVVENADKGRFEIYVNDDLAGFTVYRVHGEDRAFVHTEIAEAFEGQGLASTLVRYAMDDMLERHISVLPFCPFVNKFIAENTDPYLSLVPNDQRARFGL